MKNYTKRILVTKKSAVILLIILGTLLTAAIIACSRPGGFGFSETINAGTIDGREKYLNSFGWEIDRESEEIHEIIIPKALDSTIAEYAKMQDEQGFDFSACAGVECNMYSYIVTNYGSYSGTVYAVLYVKGNRVIGGDIHSAALNGFMHGIK